MTLVTAPHRAAIDVRVSIGICDVATLRAQGAYYAGKTACITRLLGQPTQALVFPRSSRFGKTLNLSTLRPLVEGAGVDRSSLFDALSVWNSHQAHPLSATSRHLPPLRGRPSSPVERYVPCHPQDRRLRDQAAPRASDKPRHR